MIQSPGLKLAACECSLSCPSGCVHRACSSGCVCGCLCETGRGWAGVTISPPGEGPLIVHAHGPRSRSPLRRVQVRKQAAVRPHGGAPAVGAGAGGRRGPRAARRGRGRQEAASAQASRRRARQRAVMSVAARLAAAGTSCIKAGGLGCKPY